jgi:multidrug transporter EmrE-like cation transporter
MLTELLFIIIAISLIECCGQTCLKKFFNNNSKLYYFVIGLISYLVVCYLLIQSYKYKGMGIINCIWSGISVLVVLGTGILLYNEPINKLDLLGVLFVIIGISCILWDGTHEGFRIK